MIYKILAGIMILLNKCSLLQLLPRHGAMFNYCMIMMIIMSSSVILAIQLFVNCKTNITSTTAKHLKRTESD